jgi:nifR3 family TIM-barrel protein
MHPPPTSPLQIGRHSLASRVLLAPMSGITDLPFRKLAQQHGAGLVVTEMVASRELARERPDVLRRAHGQGALKPHVIQLAGCEARWMAEGARLAEGLGADIIDINMGCPARLVTGKQSGSALMRDLDHALSLIEATVGAVRVPVTLKMRLGWDESSLNAPDLARRAQASGVQMVTVHGRTRNQFFKGRADWDRIRDVKQAVTIPVIANGDVTTLPAATSILEKSGADGLMIGRGACGAAWFPGRVAAYLATGSDPGVPPLATQAALMSRHYEEMLSHYGVALGRRNARKHLGWFVEQALPAAAQKAWRAQLCAEELPTRVIDALRRLANDETAMREAAA